MAEYRNLNHTFEPVFDENSKILILGTFPSVKSREEGFYYGHPQNRFWRVIAMVTGSELPVTISEKKKMLLANHIAVWDVIQSCSIIGSSDSSIKDVVVNDIFSLIRRSSIQTVAANGTKAYDLYMRYVFKVAKEEEKALVSEIQKLPSTSPANAAWSLEKLCEAYRELLRG